MRVLHVIDSVAVTEGGPAECVAQLAAGQAALGDAVEVLATKDAPDEAAGRGGLIVHAVGPAAGRYGYNAAASEWLQGNIQRFDAVVIHGIWQHGALAAGRASHRASLPYFVYPHGALDHDLPRRYPLRHAKKRAYWSLFGRALLERAAAVCFTSDMEARRATAYTGHWTSTVVGSGVDPPALAGDAADLRERFETLAGKPTLVFIGRLDPIKGLDVLVEAFARLTTSHPDCRLLIVGRGGDEYGASLRARAARLGCAERIVWAGVLSGADKWAAIRSAQALVLPSHRDSFGVVVAEAMAVGRPVIVTNRVGTSEIVAACGAGIVCDDDVQGVHEALARFLSADREAMSQAALRCYGENFRADAAAKRLRAAISRAIGGGARSSG